VDDAIKRAASARRRSRDAAEAATRTRARIAGQLGEQPVSANASLRRALERSEAAHLDAAELYETVGLAERAARHRADAAIEAARRAVLED
jgi:hypothetical protein